MRVYVSARAREHAHVCVCACVRACVSACVRSKKNPLFSVFFLRFFGSMFVSPVKYQIYFYAIGLCMSIHALNVFLSKKKKKMICKSFCVSVSSGEKGEYCTGCSRISYKALCLNSAVVFNMEPSISIA